MINKNEKGTVMLAFVMVVMSIVLMIGIGISFVHLRNLRAIETTEESMRAFYAADSGLEKTMFRIYNEGVNPIDDEGELSNEASFKIIVIPAGNENCNAFLYCIESYGYYKGVRRGLRLSY